jgi:hypothetical protein
MENEDLGMMCGCVVPEDRLPPVKTKIRPRPSWVSSQEGGIARLVLQNNDLRAVLSPVPVNRGCCPVVKYLAVEGGELALA